METLVRSVGDIDSTDREALEHLLGLQLRENQQIMIRVVSLDVPNAGADSAPTSPSTGARLPDWCRVYDGLSDAEVEAVEEVVLDRANLTRPS